MSDQFIWLGCAVIFVLGVVLFKSLSCIQAITGGRFRAQDRERRDHQHLLERLIEKRDVSSHDSLSLSDRHTHERMNQVSSDASVEKESMVKPLKNTKAPKEQMIVDTGTGM